MENIQSTAYMKFIKMLETKAKVLTDGVWVNNDADVGESLLKLMSSCANTTDFYFWNYIGSIYTTRNVKNLPALQKETYGLDFLKYFSFKFPMKLNLLQGVENAAWINQDFVIPKYTKFECTVGKVDHPQCKRDGQKYDFFTIKDVTIKKGDTEVYFDIYEGMLHTIEVNANSFYRKYKLSDSNDIDLTTFSLKIDGKYWTMVDNVHFLTNPNEMYSVILEDDGLYLLFNENWKSFLDTDVSKLEITFIKPTPSFLLTIDTDPTILAKVPNYTYRDYMHFDFVDKFKFIVALKNDEVSETTLTSDSLYFYDNYNNSDVVAEGTEQEWKNWGDLAQQDQILYNKKLITLADYEKEALLYGGVSCARAFDINSNIIPSKEDFLNNKEAILNSFYNYGTIVDKENVVKLLVCGEDSLLGEKAKNVVKEYLSQFLIPKKTLYVLDPKLISVKLYLNLDVSEDTPLRRKEAELAVKRTIKEYFVYKNVGIGSYSLLTLLQNLTLADPNINYILASSKMVLEDLNGNLISEGVVKDTALPWELIQCLDLDRDIEIKFDLKVWQLFETLEIDDHTNLPDIVNIREKVKFTLPFFESDESAYGTYHLSPADMDDLFEVVDKQKFTTTDYKQASTAVTLDSAEFISGDGSMTIRINKIK